MRHVRMWHWFFLLSVFLVLGFVGAERAETRAASLAQSADSQADSPVLLNETLESSSGWRMVGQVGGPTTAVAVQGNYAYVGVGLRLIVLDVSNPITPTEVSSTTPFPYFVEDVVVSGTLVYVAAGGAGLRVVDVSDPAHPIEVGAWDSPGYAEGVAVAGDIVYLADGPYGLRVIDVSDPAHPTPLGSAYDMNYAFEVAVAGGHAYIAAAGAGLLVADVTDPAHPVEVGALDTPGYAYSVAVSGTLAYVADAWEGLRVVNVSNPVSPTVLGACDTPGWALSVAVAGSTVYVADGANGLRVVDAADPANPHEVGSHQVSGLARRVAVAGDTAYVADLQGGLRVVGIADVAHPAQIGLYRPLADARRVAVAGSYAYVAAGFGGLRIVDISDPSHPHEVGAFDTEGGYANSVVVSDTYVYMATFLSGPYDMYVVSVSDPTHPTKIGAISTDGAFREIALIGQIVYAADETGLSLISVSNPTMPLEIGSIRTDEHQEATVGVAVSGTLAYLADALDGMKIVDVSDPFSPTMVSIYDSPGLATGIAVVGNRAYLADSGGLWIVDVSNPNIPTAIGFYDTPGCTLHVAVSGTLAYVSDSGGGVQMVDVSNPFTPTLVGAYDTVGFTWHTTLAGNYVYVADGQGGLLILERVKGRLTTRQEVRPKTYPGWSVTDAAGSPEPVEVKGMPITPALVIQPIGSVLSIASTCVVTNTANSGPGTLRQCLASASSGDTITFDPIIFPPTSLVTISLVTSLPALSQGNLTIDASNAGVVLDGSTLSEFASGLRIESDGNVVRGLQILHFNGPGVAGIYVRGKHNIIGGDRTQGTGPMGQGNVVSGNETGIGLHDENTISNTVIGNLIGTNAYGITALGNQVGVQIQDAASFNQVGGPTPGERNIISGNKLRGIQILGEGIRGNVVAGNYIGTDVTGARALGNLGGVVMECAAFGNVVGGTSPSERNVISGNGWGVIISDPGTTHNTVIGNFIGADANGTAPLGNLTGISICGSGFNRIGGTKSGERNIISGNLGHGISIPGGQYSDNLILGNYIGTDASGTRVLGNGLGISMDASARHDFIGGATPGERNIISGNGGAGVGIANAGVEYNFISGNTIGLDANGMTPLSNGWAGVQVEDYASHIFIQGNTIAYSGGGLWWAGVYVERSLFNTIRRNSTFNNLYQGIELADGGNQMLPAPVILTVTATSVSGTACSGCTVEVFSDAEDEGRSYEGSTAADASGAFTFTRAGGLIGPYVTATATDRDGNTSEFSTPHKAWARICLPVILKSKL